MVTKELRLFIVGKTRDGRILCKRYVWYDNRPEDTLLWSFEIETLGL